MSLNLTSQVAIVALICLTIASLAYLYSRNRQEREAKKPSEEVANTNHYPSLTDAGSLAGIGCFVLAMLTFLFR